jgi:hypothetical protein
MLVGLAIPPRCAVSRGHALTFRTYLAFGLEPTAVPEAGAAALSLTLV